MTNKEKAREIARNNEQIYHGDGSCYEIKCIDEDRYDSAMQMAEWKDKQFVQEKEKLIDNVCEWLKNNIHDYYMTCEFEQWFDDMYEDLKKEMKK